MYPKCRTWCAKFCGQHTPEMETTLPPQEVLAYVSGSCSRWQIYITFTLSVLMFLHGMNLYTSKFIAPSHLNYHCVGDHNATEGKFCTYPNGTRCSEFEFSNKYGSHTVVERWLLVCEKEYLLQFLDIVFRMGITISYVMNGYYGDKYGRKKILFVGVAIQPLIALFEVTSSLYEFFIIAHFTFALCVTSTGLMIIILVTELSSTKWRTFILGIAYVPISLSLIILPYFCKVIGNLLKINMFISIPQLLLFLCIYFIHESPYWLLVNNQIMKTQRIMFAAARINKSELPSNFRIRPVNVTENVMQLKTVWHVFIHTSIRWSIFGLVVAWFIQGYLFCISLIVLSSDSTLQVGFVTLLSTIITIGLCHMIQHVVVFNISSLLENVFIILNFLYNVENHTKIALTIIFFVSSSICVLWNLTPRTFATIVRGLGTGICISTGQLGYLTAKFTHKLLWHNNINICFICVICYILCTLCSFTLFNVHNRELPDTLEDMISFKRSCKPTRWAALRSASPTLDEIEITVTDLQRNPTHEIVKEQTNTIKSAKKQIKN